MNRKTLSLITLIIGIILLVYTPPKTNIILKDNFRIENNISYALLGNAHLTFSGVGHKHLTLMGGTYQLTSNLNIQHIDCYGSTLEVTSQIKPVIIFSVGCNIHFLKPSSVRRLGLFIGSHITGALRHDSRVAYIITYDSPVIYYLLWPFRHPYSYIIGITLLIGSLLAIVKPMNIPQRLLHLPAALWGIPVFAGALSLIYIIATFFFVAPSISWGNIEGALLGIYIHIATAYTLLFMGIWGSYFLLSYKHGVLRYYPPILGIISFLSYRISTLMLMILVIIGFVGLIVIPDIATAPLLLNSYYQDAEYKNLGKH
ncbi:MAG TPA: hypothetical protein EYP82_05205 [Hydrogenothermaceae bacterium]|nr:hypothetical protein [Hydrogenothermaceae bacterium]